MFTNLKILFLTNITIYLIKKNKVSLILDISSKYQKRNNKYINNMKYIENIFHSIDKTLLGLKLVDFCLVRSLLAYYILSKKGIKCLFLIGIKTDPFKAHAWIEINNEPLVEKENVLLYCNILKV